MEQVRVRFAPSPTGYLHIGGARTALFNWLFAKNLNGQFILRIEDTDTERSTEESTNIILDTLKWLGIDWDEGPYFQSKRLEIYKKYALELLDKGLAYEDTDPEKGTAIKFKINPEVVKWEDLIHDEISFNMADSQDLVIMKSNGFPTYNFAVVIDDGLLNITHIIRGDDHISNTPKQILLYDALNLPIPKFAHIPLILGDDGEKLSKRHTHTSVSEYKELGYLPEAMVNFLALLGWSPGDNREIMTIAELIKAFSVEKINHKPAQFNLKKFTWMNGEYIRSLTPADRMNLINEFFRNKGTDLSNLPSQWQLAFSELYKERFTSLEELYSTTKFFFTDEYEYNDKALKKFILKPGIKQILLKAKDILDKIEDFSAANIEVALRELCDEDSIKFGKIAQPIRVCITGTNVSAGLFETMELIGREKVTNRISNTISKFNL